MEFGLVSVEDIFPHPLTQELRSENDRIRGLVELAVHAEEVGLDVFAIGEHHNPPFICSADAALLAWIGASTKKLIADVRSQVALSLFTDFENFSVFKPGEHQLDSLKTTLDQVVAWSTALAPLRNPPAA